MNENGLFFFNRKFKYTDQLYLLKLFIDLHLIEIDENYMNKSYQIVQLPKKNFQNLNLTFQEAELVPRAS